MGGGLSHSSELSGLRQKGATTFPVNSHPVVRHFHKDIKLSLHLLPLKPHTQHTYAHARTHAHIHTHAHALNFSREREWRKGAQLLSDGTRDHAHSSFIVFNINFQLQKEEKTEGVFLNLMKST